MGSGIYRPYKRGAKTKAYNKNKTTLNGRLRSGVRQSVI